MTTYNIFKEYIWLVQTIYKYRKISLEQINELWRQTDMSGGLAYSRTTFNRHRNAIEDIFGLYIECDRKGGNRYYIGNSHVLEEDSVQNWLLSTLSVNNVISESLSLQDRIQMETIPDNRFLSDVVAAMKTGHKIEITYRRFGADARTHVCSPYALKVYQRRWYLLAFFEERKDETGRQHRAHFTIFALDRMENVMERKEKFKIPETFTVKDFFKDCYGIVFNDGIDAERILLRAYGREIYNMRTLLWHHSQQEVSGVQQTEEGEEYADFEFRMKPTLEFTGKILSRSDLVEVLEPQWLRVEIKEKLTKMQARYELAVEKTAHCV